MNGFLRRPICALIALAFAWNGIDGRAAEVEPYRGRPVVDVLQELQDEGLDLVFSSAVVGAELRVEQEPSAVEPRELLEEILRPLGLEARDGPSGSILILPAGTATGTLRGRVVSKAGSRPVSAAMVRIDGTERSAASGDDGSFAIPQIPVGTYIVSVEALGFATASLSRVRIIEDADTDLDVRLEAQPSFVTEVVVTPSQHTVMRQDQISSHTVTNDEAVLAPTVGGDITRVLQLLPGIASGNNTAAFNVRGSVAQDVSMVLDGLELYDPFHLQSFQSPFSLIDSNVVDRVDFFSGGFTADLGDRHGGFVEISTFVPEKPARGEIELGTLNSRFSYRAPTARGAGSWLLSTRAWYPEAIKDTTELGGGENLDPRFEDLYTKFAFNLTPRHRMSVHGLLSYDRVTFQEKGEETNENVDALTRNGYAWLRTLSAWSPRLTSETVLSGGRIDRDREGIGSEDGPVVIDDDRVVRFYGFRHDSTLQISDSHALKTGADIRLLDASYRYSRDVIDDPGESRSERLDPDGVSLGVYGAYRVRLVPQLAVELGARWDRQTYTNDNQLSPRLNAVWRPATRSEVRLALGRFNQSQRIHELQVEDGETDFSGAEVAEQVDLSFRHGFRAGPRIRLDAYYRVLSHLGPRYENLFEPIELFPEITEDRTRLDAEEARLRGVELLVRGQADRPLFWWFSYALSSAEDRIDGRTEKRSWDQTHAGKLLFGYRRADRWSVALSASIHTGWPTTPVLPDPDAPSEETTPGPRNTDRFNTYARVDLKGRYAVPLPRGRLWLTMEVVNLLDRSNECCLDEAETVPLPGGSFDVRRRFDNWLGFSPSFSVLWEF